jgi:hypothetical protein
MRVLETIAGSYGLRDRTRAQLRAFPAALPDDSGLLGAQAALEHPPEALAEGRLVNTPLVGIDPSLHDILAQSIGAGDQHHVPESAFCVEGEDHPARGLVGSHHPHDRDGQGHLRVIEAIVDAVDDGAVGEDGGEAAAARLDQRVLIPDMKIAFVLACEAGGGQVFGRGRAADRDAQVRTGARLQLSIGGEDLVTKRSSASRRIHDAPGLGRSLGQRLQVGDVEARQLRGKARPGVSLGQGIAIRLGRDRKSVRHADG